MTADMEVANWCRKIPIDKGDDTSHYLWLHVCFWLVNMCTKHVICNIRLKKNYINLTECFFLYIMYLLTDTFSFQSHDNEKPYVALLYHITTYIYNGNIFMRFDGRNHTLTVINANWLWMRNEGCRNRADCWHLFWRYTSV